LLPGQHHGKHIRIHMQAITIMNNANKQYLLLVFHPFFMFSCLEIITATLGISDIGLGIYYHTHGNQIPDECTSGFTPVPELLITIGVLAIAGYLPLLNCECEFKYKFQAFISTKILIFGLSVAECAIILIKHRAGCSHQLFNYTTGVSILRIILYVMFALVWLTISIHDVMNQTERKLRENTKDLAEEDIIGIPSYPQSNKNENYKDSIV